MPEGLQPPTPAAARVVGMLQSAFNRHWFDADALALWSDLATVQAWLDVEVALAATQAELGMIPRTAADTIASKADARRFDFERIARDTAHAMHPFVPVLAQFEALCGEPAAGYIHWGATTQNIFETGAALQLRRAHRRLLGQLDDAIGVLAALARRHRDLAQAGRTHGQHALPITFGFKLAAWRAELRRHRERLAALEARVFVASMGGAVGAFAAMKGQGRAVQDGVARRLGLRPIGIPMRAAGDGPAEYVSTTGLFAASAEKIAGEIVFLQRTEIAEVAERHHAGKVGSSTMAQKRNPAHAINIIGLSRMLRGRVPLMMEAAIRMNEGDAAASNVADATLPEASILACSIASGLAALLRGLVVDEAAMARNLALTGGAIVTEAVMMELGRHLGRHKAHHVLYDVAMRTAETGEPFRSLLAADAEIRALGAAIDIDALLAPANYLGEAGPCVDDELAH